MTQEGLDILRAYGVSAPPPDTGAVADPEREAWLRSRLGKITASQFPRISFGGRKADNGLTQGAMTYLYQLIADHATQEIKDELYAPSVLWGREHEAEALAEYRAETGLHTMQGELITTSELVGGTPDAIVLDVAGIEEGIVEVKCPYDPTEHIRNIATNEIPKKYRDQVLGYMWLTDALWAEFVSYDPRNKAKPLHIIRIERRQVQLELDELQDRVLKFETILIDELDRLNIPIFQPNNTHNNDTVQGRI